MEVVKRTGRVGFRVLRDKLSGVSVRAKLGTLAPDNLLRMPRPSSPKLPRKPRKTSHKWTHKWTLSFESTI
eukprot:4948821-Amphidinium_carterae.1